MSASIIPFKISQLALLVSQRKHIPVRAALSYIYDSPFYTKLYDENAKWWYLDTESLYRLLEQSWVKNDRAESHNVVVFLTFCAENYAINIVKIQSTGWEKISANQLCDMSLISSIHRTLII